MTQKKYLASLDQSTTSTKFSLYYFDGTLVDQQIVPHKQISLYEGWLEHDPSEINQSVSKSIQAVIKRQQKTEGFTIDQILGLGVCNQRQTVVCWDAETGKPLNNAIVWCDSRTKDVCQKFKQKYGNRFTQKTGLPVSTYFSMFKIIWLMENIAGLKQKVQEKKVRFGTIDTWVVYYLTGKYVTDASNASRTHLIDLKTGQWDKELLQSANIPIQCLPTIVSSFETVGQITIGDLKGVPINCILGDQQSSAYAHNLGETQMKITYGTGCFLLCNIGLQPIFDESFVTTIMHQNSKYNSYGFQISVECGGGTINWAKKIGLLNNYDQLNNLSTLSDQVYFMPSFGTIFSPFWKSNVQGAFVGLNFNVEKTHLLRALLDSIAYRLYDNIKNQKFNKITKIIVDGGMTVNKQFMQMQADVFNKQIQVRALDTCWGVAKGVLTATNTKTSQIKLESLIYNPTQKHEDYLIKYQKWVQARNKFYGWN